MRHHIPISVVLCFTIRISIFHFFNILNLSRNDKSGICELCNKKFDQRALDAMRIAYEDIEETDPATIKGFHSQF